MRVLYPTDRIIEVADREGFVNELATIYGRAGGVRCNIVVTQDGRTADAFGKSQGISNDVDRALLAALRRQTQVVLTGGATARAEQYRKPKTARLAILTKSGDLTGVPALEDRMGPKVMALTSAKGSESLHRIQKSLNVEILQLGDFKGDHSGQMAAIAALRKAGFSDILNESGPNGIRALDEAGLLQEICLTVTKVSSSSFHASDLSLRPLGVDATKYELALLASSDNSLFIKWLKKPAADDGVAGAA